jgi:hypothetical protein
MMKQLSVSPQACELSSQNTAQKKGVAMNRTAYWSLFALICLIGLASCSSGNNGSSNNNNTTGNTNPTPVVAITATSGGPQSAVVGQPFAAPLVATVTTNGSPASGVAVTFTAPATGASGTFVNKTATETDKTDANGVATSTTFTANATSGGPYTVSATASGATTPATFSLTNTVETIAATSGESQTALVGGAFAAPLAATVTTNGSPVSGVAVTFTAPATGASGTFANQTTTETVPTGANGVASTTFTANTTSGGPYTVTATVSGVATPATFSLTNTVRLFSFYLSGLEAGIGTGGPRFYAVAGSVNIDGSGTVLGGEQDYNDARGFTSPEPQGDTISGGTLAVNAATGQGTLTLNTSNLNVGVGGIETLGVQFVNANHALIVQFDGSATSSGSMDLQTLPSTLSGGYAFTLSGVGSTQNPIVSGGVFSVSGTSLQNGIVDVDNAGIVTTQTPFTGTVSGPDAFGRGTITGTGMATTFSYYTVGPEAIRLIDVDTADSSIGSAFGQGTGTFDKTSLGSSVFGFESNSSNTNTLLAAAGMFTTTPATGTFQGVADNDENGTVKGSASPIGGSYFVSRTFGGITYNGYGRLTIAPGDLGDVSVIGIYLTDPNLNLNDPNNTATGLGGGLVTDLDSLLGGTGVITPQTDTAPTDFAGVYDFGGQEFNADPIWEFDFVGQGSVTGGVLTGTGLVSDPGSYFSTTLTDTGVTFSGTATPDLVNVGRFTIPLTVTVAGAPPANLNVVIYQASAGQLFWLDEDPFSVYLGPLEQQGTLTGLLSASKSAVNTRLRRK